MLVRPFQLADYRSVEALLEAVLCGECFEETREALIRQLSMDSELVQVAEKDGRLVGLLIGTMEGKQGFVYRICVHEDYRRQGVGGALIRAVNARFRSRNVREVMAVVDGHRRHIAPFFESFGLAPVDLAESSRQLAIVAG
ncbi:MAG TPA: GNAT family N-acetyltransferase [Paenibacillaceae bacterium]